MGLSGKKNRGQRKSKPITNPSLQTKQTQDTEGKDLHQAQLKNNGQEEELEDGNKEEARANRIASKQYYVNIIMMTATCMLFIVSFYQAKLTRDAVKDGQTGTEALAKQFKAENAPYIIVNTTNIFGVNWNVLGNVTETSFVLENLGKYPTRIFKNRITYFTIREGSPLIDIVSKFQEEINAMTYIQSSGGGMYVSVGNPVSITDQPKKQFNVISFANSMLFIVIGAEYVYQDLLNKEDFYKTQFIVQLIITSENRVIKVTPRFLYQEITPYKE